MVVGGLLLLCGDRNKSPPEKLWRDEQKLDCHVVQQQQQPQLRINVEREMVDIDFFSVVIPLLSPSPATPPLLCLTNGSQHPCHLFTSTHATSSSSYLLERERDSYRASAYLRPILCDTGKVIASRKTSL